MHLHFWHWWIIAAVFLVLELVSFTTFFLWLGMAAAVVGVVKWVVPSLGWHGQFLLFAVLAVLSVVAWWRVARKKQRIESGVQVLNQRAHSMVGNTYTLVADVKNGRSKIKAGDSVWQVQCEQPLTEGTSVKVVRAEALLLHVESAE